MAYLPAPKEMLHQWVTDAKEYQYFDNWEPGNNRPTPTLIGCMIIMLAVYVRNLPLQYICRVRGHKWIDESYGNSDSGGDGGYCERCGFSFWYQYY